MRKSIKLTSAALALLFACTLGVACTKKQDEQQSPSDIAETNANKVVATLDGKEIMYNEYYELLTSYAGYYGLSPDSLDSYAGVEAANQFRDSVVTQLLDEEIMKLKATELGLDNLSEDELAEAEANAKEYLDNLLAQFVSEVEDEDTEYDDVNAEAQSRMDKYLAEQGYTEDYIKDYYKTETILNKVYYSVTDTVKVSDESIESTYNDALETQKSLYESDPQTAISNYATGKNEFNAYVPGGINYVKHILIAIPEDVRTELSKLEGDEYTTRYNEELAKLKAKADEVLAKVKAGEDFDTLIKDYGDDKGMSSEPYATDGYAAYVGASLAENFLNASLKLENVGDYTTELVASEFGYHIIKCVSKTSPAAIDLVEIRDDIESSLLTTMKNETWQSTLESWRAEHKIVRFTETYYSVETAATATPNP